MRAPRLAKVIASVFTGALLFSGCNAGWTAVSPGGGVAGDRNELVVATGAEPINLDFTTTSGAAIPQLLLHNVYETLVKIGQNGDIEPLLAHSWTISEDRLIYDFYLQPGVTFFNLSRTPFTAHDVVASFDRTQTEWLNAIAGGMAIIEKTEAIDDLHVRVTLSRPSNQFLFTLGTPAGAIFPADIDFDKATSTIGTGPFTVTSVSPGQHIILEGRQDYWGEPPGMHRIEVRYMQDTTAAVNAFRAGEINMMVNLASGDQTRQLENEPGVQVLVGTSTGDVLWSFNNRRPPFDDVRVRRAFAYAVDFSALNDAVAAGFGTLVATMVTPQDPFFEDLTNEFPYDPARARELLSEYTAEYGITELNVTLDVPNLLYATQAAEVIQSYLAQVRVNATINILEFPAVWLDQVFRNHGFDMSIIMHSEAWDLLTVFGDPNYYVGYDNPEIMQIANEADQGSPEQWVAGMRTIVREIVADAPAIVLYLAPRLTVADINLTGIQPNGVTESMDLTQVRWR